MKACRLTIFIIFSFFLSCATNNENQKEEKKLLGKWQLTNSYSPNLKKVIESVTVSVKKPDNYRGILLGSINSFPPDQDSVKAYDNFSEKDKVYNFKSDHTFEITYLNSYKLNEEGEFIKTSFSEPDTFEGKWKLIFKGKVELDYDEDDYLKCCVYDWDGQQWSNLKANKQLLEKRKNYLLFIIRFPMIHFIFMRKYLKTTLKIINYGKTFIVKLNKKTASNSVFAKGGVEYIKPLFDSFSRNLLFILLFFLI